MASTVMEVSLAPDQFNPLIIGLALLVIAVTAMLVRGHGR